MNHSITCKGGRMGALFRRLFPVLLALLLAALALPTSASASEVRSAEQGIPTKVYLEGTEILENDCLLIGGITYVPLRLFCEVADGCDITWDAKSATATVRSDSLYMTVGQGLLYIYANGHYLYTVGNVLNLGGRLYVPIRPLARAFDMELQWNNRERCVELERGDRAAISWASYDSDDVYWLSRIIHAEAGGEPFEGKIAVGNVVLNRVASKSYPNTVYGVIFDRKHGTQFSPVAYGTIYKKPSEESVIAAKICLEGYTLSEDILFFMNPRIATNNWISKNRPYAFTIANHDFYN